MSDSDFSKQRRQMRRAQHTWDNMSEPAPLDSGECENCHDIFYNPDNKELCNSCDSKHIRKCVECRIWRKEKEFPSSNESNVCKYCL